MSPAQRFFEHENLERLNAERELAADKDRFAPKSRERSSSKFFGNKYSGP